jgi:hypothetical protein
MDKDTVKEQIFSTTDALKEGWLWRLHPQFSSLYRIHWSPCTSRKTVVYRFLFSYPLRHRLRGCSISLCYVIQLLLLHHTEKFRIGSHRKRSLPGHGVVTDGANSFGSLTMKGDSHLPKLHQWECVVKTSFSTKPCLVPSLLLQARSSSYTRDNTKLSLYTVKNTQLEKKVPSKVDIHIATTYLSSYST